MLGLAATNPFGSSGTLYASNSKSYESRRRQRRSMAFTPGNFAFSIVIVGCVLALRFTNFQACTFLAHWLPQLPQNVLQFFCR
jgi:hypothetical protein